MEPAPAKRLQGAAAVLLRRLRGIPWLTTAVCLGGLILALALNFADWRALQERLPGKMAFAEGVQDAGRRAAWLEFFRAGWVRATWLLLPAAVLAAVRLRGRALIFPVAVASAHLAFYWIGTDLIENLHRSLNDPLGLEPSPAAYTAKLMLMATFALSPPLMLWLYYRARLLDQYMLRNFLPPFAICLGGMIALMISMDLLNNLRDYTAGGYSAGRIIMLYVQRMPLLLVRITEAALLLATLFSLGKMSRYNELTAMHSAGRSVTRVLLPLLICGLWASVGLMAMNYQFAPDAERIQDEARSGGGGRGANPTAVPNVLYRNREALRTWYLHSVPYDLSPDNPMHEVYVWQQDSGGDIQKCWFARRAFWQPGSGAWQFQQVVEYTFADPATGKPLPHPGRTEVPFLEQKLWPETPGGMLSDKLDPDYLGVPGLLSVLKSRATLPDKIIAQYETMLHWRFALPLRCFLIVLLAAPLGIAASRRNVLGGVSAALGIFMVVFFLSQVFLTSGRGGYLPPFFAAWSVNLAFAAAGILLLRYRSRNRLPFFLNPLRRAAK